MRQKTGTQMSETLEARGKLQLRFKQMKRNKSSEVIPLRPHASDRKEMVRTEQTCLLSRLKKSDSHCVIFQPPSL